METLCKNRAEVTVSTFHILQIKYQFSELYKQSLVIGPFNSYIIPSFLLKSLSNFNLTDNCYRFKLSSSVQNYADSEAYCQRKGGKIVSNLFGNAGANYHSLVLLQFYFF